MKNNILILLFISLILGTYVKKNKIWHDSTRIQIASSYKVRQERQSNKNGVQRNTIIKSFGTLVGNLLRFRAFAVYDPISKSHTIARATEIAHAFNINPETFVCVLNQESGLESRVRVNGELTDQLKCGDNGESCGLGQIKLGTWQSIRRHAGWSIDDLRGDDEENMKTTAYGLSTVWPEHWTGYRICRDMGYKL